jgi:DivIVA domain-containing protein
LADDDTDRTDQPHGEPEPPGPSAPARDDVPDNLRAVSFHSAVRGYDRREVDRYVERVNRVIAELEMTRSPESAVRHALERVGEQTSGILQHARQTADEITHTASSEAEETTARAKAEARDIVAGARAEAERIVAAGERDARDRLDQGEGELEALRRQGDENRAREEERLAQLRREAETEMRELREQIDAIRDERERVLAEIHELAGRLERLTEIAPEGATDEPS